MEPITTIAKVVETAEKVAEVVQKIQKNYDVSKKMKSVAEFEGKDQIQATFNMVSPTNKLPSKGTKELEEKRGLQARLMAQDRGDFSRSDTFELKESFPGETSKERLSVFVEGMPLENENLSKLEVFNDSAPLEATDLFVEDMPSSSEELSKRQNLFDESTPIAEADSPLEKTEGNINPSETAENNFQAQEKSESNHSLDISEESEQRKEGLTNAQKKELKEETGWSDGIVDSFRTIDEVQIYRDAELQEGEINGKPALLQPNIDGNACNEAKWPDWSNKDLAEEGYPPRDKTGNPYELHHIGQNPNSPLAELTYEQHHCNGNFKKLHTFDESSIDRQQFKQERIEHWKARFQAL